MDTINAPNSFPSANYVALAIRATDNSTIATLGGGLRWPESCGRVYLRCAEISLPRGLYGPAGNPLRRKKMRPCRSRIGRATRRQPHAYMGSVEPHVSIANADSPHLPLLQTEPQLPPYVIGGFGGNQRNAIAKSLSDFSAVDATATHPTRAAQPTPLEGGLENPQSITRNRPDPSISRCAFYVLPKEMRGPSR